MTTATASRRGLRETEAFTRALLDLAAKRLRPHCSDPGTSQLWLSELEAERAEAAKLCQSCPVIIECGIAATAHQERWHVWGGRDYTRR